MSYKPILTRTWWLKHRAFKAYMLREATVLPLLFFLLTLCCGIYALWRGPSQWQAWQITMKHPAVLAINSLALVASLYHAWTFFQLFPRVMPIRLGSKTLPAQVLIAGQWAGLLAVFVLFTWLFRGSL